MLAVPMTAMQPRQHAGAEDGFSLVEVAIVLVVIGIILGAVLQGRALIASAEYKSFSQEIRQARGAFHAFRDRYGALPGDFARADQRIDAAAPVPGASGGDGTIDNGANGPACLDDGDEGCMAWQHLRYAGMLGGDPTLEGEEASPEHPWGGAISGFFTGSGNNGTFGHNLLIRDVPVDIARRLDREEDDNRCNGGRITGQDCDDDDATDWPDADTVNVVYEL